jgi:hypothetical protein
MSFRERRAPERAGLRRAFELLCWEGAFAMAYEAWIVGPNYLSGLAGEAGMSAGLVTLLASFVSIGSVGQLIGIWGIWRLDRPAAIRRYTLRLASAARALWLIPWILALYWGLRPEPFPARAWFVITACTGCGSALLASSSAAAWNSWVRGLVPEGLRGRFFGLRQRYVMAGLILANGLGALWVGWKPGQRYVGYLLLGGLGLVSAACSTWLLSRVPEHASEAASAPAQPGRLSWDMLLEPLRDRRFRRVLLLGALFNGTIQMAGPYFPYFFTREAGIAMGWIAAWSMLTNLGCVLAAVPWGRKLDETGDPLPVLRLCGFFVGLSPLFYLSKSAQWITFIAPLDYFTNGLVWSGYLLGTTALLFEATPEGRNATYFSVYAAASGLAGALGVFVGGQLAVRLEPWGGFRALWVVAAALRVSVVWAMLGLPARLAALPRATSES